MTPLQIARRRLRNSRLVGRAFGAPDEVVRWHGAMQAQDYEHAKWSVAQRSKGVGDADISAAVASGRIIRTHVLRATWHFVAREDVRWLLALTGSRLHRQNAGRFRELGLDAATLTRCERLILSALEREGSLTRIELGRVVEGGGVDISGQRLPHILMHCELQSAICSGAPAGKRHTYARLDDRVPPGSPIDADEARAKLVQTYLRSHGPATVEDLTWWCSLPKRDIRDALEALGEEVEPETVEGLAFWSLPSGDPSARRDRRVHLLQPYDEIVVGYTKSRYFGDPRAARARVAWADRSLPSGVVLSDAHVLGHWRRRIEKGVVTVEVISYEDAAKARGVDAAARELGRFLGVQPVLEVVRI